MEVLRGLGRLEPVDGVRVQALLSLAAAVDSEPLNASLWRELRAVEASLRAEVTDDGAWRALVDEMSAKVGD